MIEFKLPALGENVEQGDLVRLMISPGVAVSEGQAVMELETDKAVVEVPSSVTGTVKEIQRERRRQDQSRPADFYGGRQWQCSRGSRAVASTGPNLPNLVATTQAAFPTCGESRLLFLRHTS